LPKSSDRQRLEPPQNHFAMEILFLLRALMAMLDAIFMPQSSLSNAITPAELGYSFPAEWEKHEATWLGWPHNASDWPGKFEIIPWIYGEMVRKISAGENIRLIIRHKRDEQFARHVFKHVGVDLRKIKFVIHPTNRGWTRDTGPIFVKRAAGILPAEPNAPASSADATAAARSIWTIPAGWKSVTPSSTMLFAQFLIQDGDAKAEVNISQLAGEGGGLLANVNRWRGQLGLPQVAQEDDFSKMVSSVDSANGQIQIVDMNGTNAKTGQPARLVGAVVPQNGQSWFYKLMGDEKIVAAQKEAFIKFIQSANYPK
jgi:hypothetical protein